MSQHMEALASGNAVRAERARLRREAIERPGMLRDLLLDPPAAVHGMAIVDLLRLPGAGCRSTAALALIGRRAANAGVNLLLPVGLPAARAAREWCAKNAVWRRSGPSSVTLVARRTA